MESFVMAIPGAFTSKWGVDVWRKVSEAKPYEDMDLRTDYTTDELQSGADLPISTLPDHRSPLSHRSYHPLSLLRPIGRIFGIRITNGAYRGDMTMTRSIPCLPSNSLTLDNRFSHGDTAIYDLCKRIRHLAGTCNNYSIFTNKDLWFGRARGCAETAASLVFCADIKPELFGNLEWLLPPLHNATLARSMAPGSDGLFVVRLECLSFVIVHRGLVNHDGIKLDAHAAINALARFGTQDASDDNDNDDDDEKALRNARKIDQYFERARQFCVYGLRETLKPDDDVEKTEEQVKEVLTRDHEDDISMLEHIALATDRTLDIDRANLRICLWIIYYASGLMYSVCGAHFDNFEETGLSEPIRFFGSTNARRTFLPQFIFLHQRLRLLCSYSSKLRDIVNGQSNGAYQEILDSLRTLWDESDKRRNWSGVHLRHLMERQLWRLQDLRDGGGFGLWVELYFLVIQPLIIMPLSPDALSSLLLGMFRAIASTWRQHKLSIGTQRVVLNIICDIAIWERGPLSNCTYPKYVTDELLVLVGNIVEGQSGSHIDEAMKELEDAINEEDDFMMRGTDLSLFRAEAVKVISRSRAPARFSKSSDK